MEEAPREAEATMKMGDVTDFGLQEPAFLARYSGLFPPRVSTHEPHVAGKGSILRGIGCLVVVGY